MPLGELAALATALCWTGTSTFFSLAGEKVGSVVVNRVRLLLAVLLLVPTHWVLLGEPLPLGARPEAWGWLALSSIIGLVIGDAFLFQAFVWIGPRLSMLMMSLAPVIAAIFAWLFLGEVLTLLQIAGLCLTLAGVGWVVLRRRRTPGVRVERNYVLGILFGLGAAAGQALGLVTAKKGLEGDISALSGNVIRMLVAAGVIWFAALVTRQAGNTLRRVLAQRRAGAQVLGGAIFGPFLGVWLSLVAIQLTEVGIASTIMALPPVFLLPVGYFFFGERVGWQAVTGTMLAVLGVALLFLT